MAEESGNPLRTIHLMVAATHKAANQATLTQTFSPKQPAVPRWSEHSLKSDDPTVQPLILMNGSKATHVF